MFFRCNLVEPVMLFEHVELEDIQSGVAVSAQTRQIGKIRYVANASTQTMYKTSDTNQRRMQDHVPVCLPVASRAAEHLARSH